MTEDPHDPGGERVILEELELSGRHLTVCEARPSDAPRVLEMYQRLSHRDTHLRFHSGFRPNAAFVDNWLDRSTRKGAVLIVIEGDTETGPVIADAGYIPSDPQTAELAMTIDPERRGWLGPYLLDVMVEHARAAGITNLVAEVLTNNCAMMTLLRARGCAFEPSSDLSVARVLIGTEAHTPVWAEGAPRPRILIEGSSGSWHGARAAQQAGIAIMVCPGPERGRAHRCPLLEGRQCPLVDDADAVIITLPPDDVTGRLLEAHERQGLRSQPMALSDALRERFGDIADRVTFELDPLVSGPETVDAAQAAIAEARDPDDQQGSQQANDGCGGPDRCDDAGP